MRISIILAITLVITLAPNALFAAESAVPAGFEQVRMRTDGKIIDMYGNITAIPNLEHAGNTESRRYYTEVDANGDALARRDFFIIRDANSGYVRPVSAQPAASKSNNNEVTSIESAERIGHILSTGSMIDQMLGNTSDKLGKLRQIASTSEGQYSAQMVQDYKLYLAATGSGSYSLNYNEREIVNGLKNVVNSEEYTSTASSLETYAPSSQISLANSDGNISPAEMARLQQSTGMPPEKISQLSSMLKNGNKANTAEQANAQMESSMGELVKNIPPDALNSLVKQHIDAQSSYEAYSKNLEQYTKLVNMNNNGSFSPEQMGQVQQTAQSYLEAANVNYTNYTLKVGQLNTNMTGIVNNASGMINQQAAAITGKVPGLMPQAAAQMQTVLSQAGAAQLTNQLSSKVTAAVSAAGGAIKGAVMPDVSGLFDINSFASGFGNGMTSFNVFGDFGGAAAMVSGAPEDIDGSTPLIMPGDFLTSDKKNMMMACDQKPYGDQEGNMPVIAQNAANCKRSLDNFRLGRRLSNATSKDATIPLVQKSTKDGKVEVDFAKPEGGLDTWEGQYNEYINSGKELVKAYAGREGLLCSESKPSGGIPSGAGGLGGLGKKVGC